MTSDNKIQDKINARTKTGNARFYSVENFLYSKSISRLFKVSINKTTIFPVESYNYETLKDENKLTVSENKVVRKIFVIKTDEISREWRKLKNWKFYALCTSNDIHRKYNLVQVITVDWTCGCTYIVVICKSKGSDLQEGHTKTGRGGGLQRFKLEEFSLGSSHAANFCPYDKEFSDSFTASYQL